MQTLLNILYLFYLPISLIKLIYSKFKKKKEDIYYFVGVWVLHQINEEQYQSSIYSLWIRKEERKIPTEKEVKVHLTATGINIVNFKISSISEWTKSDYDEYCKGEIVEDGITRPVEKREEEVDYQSLIDKAVEEEDYETAANLKKILDEKNKKD